MFAHIDADAFFASVLQRKYPKLKGKTLLALGMGGGCVIAASYEAKAKGVKTGMRLTDARKLVPDAIAMPSDFRATYDATRQLFALLEKFCPGGVEEASPDEGYLCLDTRSRVIPSSPRPEAEGVSRDGCATRHDTLYDFAHALQSETDRCIDLPISIGIAPTKTLAKMASKHRKPHGICIIEEKDIDVFLQEKDIGSIPGIGWKSTPKMKARGFLTALDLARADPFIVEKILGKTGLELQREMRGDPVYRVITDLPSPKSISRCRSFRATSNRDFLYAQVMMHLQRCSAKLRRHELECARVGIWVRGADYKSGASAERSVGRYVAEEALLRPFVKEAFEEVIQTCRGAWFTGRSLGEGWPSAPTRPHRITQVGLVLSDFRPADSQQISLFEKPESLNEIASLQTAIDELRKKYGTESVRFGGTVAT